MKKKIDMRKGYDDELVEGLPSATKLVNYGSIIEPSKTPSKFNSEQTAALFLEGGAAEAEVEAAIELKPADEMYDSDDVDVFGASATSFMSAKMRSTYEKNNSVDHAPLKKSFWSWGSKTDGEQKFNKEKAKLDFLSSYSSVIELA